MAHPVFTFSSILRLIGWLVAAWIAFKVLFHIGFWLVVLAGGIYIGYQFAKNPKSTSRWDQ